MAFLFCVEMLYVEDIFTPLSLQRTLAFSIEKIPFSSAHTNTVALSDLYARSNFINLPVSLK